MRIIGLALNFLLTLSFSRVACERSFSALKVIKNHMRNTLYSDNLNSGRKRPFNEFR